MRMPIASILENVSETECANYFSSKQDMLPPKRIPL